MKHGKYSKSKNYEVYILTKNNDKILHRFTETKEEALKIYEIYTQALIGVNNTTEVVIIKQIQKVRA